MSETYPYPEAEHYVFPKNHLEMIDEHIQKFPTGPESRQEITLLLAYYKDTPFYEAIRYYAHFNKLAIVGDHSEADDTALNAYSFDFFAGGAAAMHMNLHPAPHNMRQWILSRDPLYGLNDQESSEEERQHQIVTAVNSMDEWRREGAVISFDSQPQPSREKILELAIAVYNDHEKPQGRDQIFIDGYMFTSELIWRYGGFYKQFAPLPRV